MTPNNIGSNTEATQSAVPNTVSGLETQSLNDRTPASDCDFELAEPGIKPIGRYQTVRVLGKGGMGIVYLAHDPTMARLVALKILNSEHAKTEHARKRFAIEIEAVARLRHPNVVRIYDTGCIDDVPFFTMEYLGGGNLAKNFDRLKSDRAKAIGIMTKVARAVHYAHDRGVLHRDLKPTNILLDENDEPVVGDFGLAKLLDSEHDITHSEAFVGTPQYMSPEALARNVRNIKVPSDVYSLGVTLHELLTGERPDPSLPPRTTDTRDATGRLPSALAPVADPALSAIVERCLRYRADERYQTAEALAVDLEKWGQGEAPTEAAPVVAAPTKPERPPSKPISRRRFVSVLAASGALLAFGGMGGALYQRYRTREIQEKLRWELAQFGRVQLQNADGSLRYGAALGAGPEAYADIEDNVPFARVACGKTGLLELLPASGVKSFRLSALVRQDSLLGQSSGSIGLYVGRSRWSHVSGDYQCFLKLSFREESLRPDHRPNPESEFGMHVTYVGVNSDSNPIGGCKLPAQTGAWRKLVLVLDGERVFAEIEGQTVNGRTRGELRGTVGSLRPNTFAPDFQTSEGLGLFVERCRASVRELCVERLA